MTSEEFIRRAVGLPWVDRACSWSAMDCWGVVMMYFRYVYDEELPFVEGYSSGDKTIASGFSEQVASGKWEKVDSAAGDCIVFTAYKDGVPCHVGVVVNGAYVLHSAGNEEHDGHVRCDRLDAFRRFHRDIELYRYTGCRCL